MGLTAGFLTEKYAGNGEHLLRELGIRKDMHMTDLIPDTGSLDGRKYPSFLDRTCCEGASVYTELDVSWSGASLFKKKKRARRGL